MKSKKISPNSTAFIYDDIESYYTCVFLIEKESRYFLIDTCCGSGSMTPVLDMMKSSPVKKELVVINTHFHWDHVWGNWCFQGYPVIGHEMCRKLLDEHWEAQVQKNGKYIAGTARKQLPGITFTNRLCFQEDGIELFHSPGHTSDCISIFDHETGVLYVGDNLEKPIIYIENSDTGTYINTLVEYLRYETIAIIGSHTLDLTREDISDTIRYLKGLQEGREFLFQTEYERRIHAQNAKTMQMPGKPV